MKKLFFINWPDNFEQLSIEQARVISVVRDSQLKTIICITLLGTFLVVFGFLIYFVFANLTYGIIGFASIETMLSFSFYKIISHYFPAINEASKSQ